MTSHLSIVVLTLITILHRIDASPKEIEKKFREEGIVPDVLADLPEL